MASAEASVKKEYWGPVKGQNQTNSLILDRLQTEMERGRKTSKKENH